MQRDYRWPNDAQCVVMMTLDFDGHANELTQGIEPLGIYSLGGYSSRRGAPRIIDIWDKHGIKGTLFMPGWDAEQHPGIVKDVHARGHEIAAHGYLHEGPPGDPAKEAALLDKSNKILSDLIGHPPVGYRNPSGAKSNHTARLLHELGYIYESSDKDDDMPYLPTINGEVVRDMIHLPNNTSSLDDSPIYRNAYYAASDMLSLWKAEFDTIYNEFGFYMITSHPRGGRGSGTPARARVIDELIRYIKGFDRVHFTRMDDLARWCLDPANGFTSRTGGVCGGFLDG